MRFAFDVPRLAAQLSSDTINRLERAANDRYEEGNFLAGRRRLLCPIYLYGYSVEMCLAAAYFRSAGFSPNTPISRETRERQMNYARTHRDQDNEPLMSSDPHPLVGWARLLQWRRHLSAQLGAQHTIRLREAVNKAKTVYKHWRPELRYKTKDVVIAQLQETRKCVEWFIANRGRL
jgi:hypothetical protein